MNISRNIEENRKYIDQIFHDCSDIKVNELMVGKGKSQSALLIFIEVTLSNSDLGESGLGKFIESLNDCDRESMAQKIEENAFGIADATVFSDMDQALQSVLTGDPVIFIDGVDRAVKIADKGYPALSLQETDSEKVIRGSNEGFSDSIKTNTALIRRRLRSTRLKCREISQGIRSHTLVNILYVEDLVQPDIVASIQAGMEKYVIDQMPDTGIIEQLGEEKWYSPFPQYQTTKRPDTAVMSLLEGRVVVLCDNSPVALVAPVTFNSFLKTADDYYNRTLATAMARIIRYGAAIIAMSLPGLYLAVTNFHTQVLPTSLLISFWNARQGCPFPQVLEVLLMEMSFELLREAGIRLPGAMGNTIGIVGGLIIGQSAVEANLVSPIVVILVAFTALCSFAIPNEEFAFAFRILKFAIILMCAWLGFFGFLLSAFITLIHLAKLESFGYPYLMPFAGGNRGEKDSLVRWPLRKLRFRPGFTREGEKVKLKFKKE